LFGFDANYHEFANSVVAGNVSNEVLYYAYALQCVKMKKSHTNKSLGANNDSMSDIPIYSHFVERGADNWVLDCFAFF
jgi:hypothetical protein